MAHPVLEVWVLTYVGFSLVQDANDSTKIKLHHDAHSSYKSFCE